MSRSGLCPGRDFSFSSSIAPFATGDAPDIAPFLSVGYKELHTLGRKSRDELSGQDSGSVAHTDLPLSDHSMSSSHSQNWDPARYRANARFVSELGMPVVELLSPQPGERILDLGCGDGALT